MNPYYVSQDKIDLKYYPNYSFEIGDVDGDGRMEFVSMNQTATLLKVVNLDGETLFEEKLGNTGNWGTALVCVADLDGDSRAEVIAPNGMNIAVFDGNGRKIRECAVGTSEKDDYGIAVSMLCAARVAPGKPGLVAAVSGGEVVALDGELREIWRTGGFRHDFGHEFFVADVDGDGLDEIAFSTADHIGRPLDHDGNAGDLALLDHDGSVLLRERVDRFVKDTHFDDIAMADFLSNGRTQILLEKGFLLDLDGKTIWDLSDQMEHGQWIAHAPDPSGKGRVGFISELWGYNMKSMLFTGAGRKIKDINGFPWPKVDGMGVVPSRCHAIRWTPESEPEIFMTQQISLYPHECTKTVHFRPVALFMDLRGNLAGEMPFDDTLVEGYYYNGETHSRVADVDGDGRQEVVFPKQDGHVMIIKKR